ncbi:hypothetical protein GCM10010470_64750 [Saccharopolyspora taberi]|uniref:Uncharacterized protein n=1 Tax=Saccharopolyspora taberi TaxID=60895 RepID=A0ABN3VP43_9PSEU
MISRRPAGSQLDPNPESINGNSQREQSRPGRAGRTSEGRTSRSGHGNRGAGITRTRRRRSRGRGLRPVPVEALQDPKQNIFIAAQHIADLKQQTEFADVPADQLTPGQMQELAARYNGGPHWQGEDAQGYGRGFLKNIPQAREAME